MHQRLPQLLLFLPHQRHQPQRLQLMQPHPLSNHPFQTVLALPLERSALAVELSALVADLVQALAVSVVVAQVVDGAAAKLVEHPQQRRLTKSAVTP